jgi:triacylglycerol lipase
LAPGEPFDLVGFSMGGLVCRYYVQRLGGVERVGRLITISAPHLGTYWAYTGGNKGSRQMRPGSEFLVELNRDARILERVKFASIWTPLDLTIVPAWSSRLGVGEEFQVSVMLHPWMLGSRRCLEVVGGLLESVEKH